MRAYFLPTLCGLLGMAISVKADPLLLQEIGGDFTQPIFIGSPEGDHSRLFVVEHSGLIKIVQDGVVLPTPFLDISSLIQYNGELGVIGFTFDPAFTTNGRFYVDYIAKNTTNVVIDRYQAPGGSNVANPASREQIIQVAQDPNELFHKGGWLSFRPGDPNNLYISTGDGGRVFDPDNFAQRLDDNRGKILRIDVSGNGPGYAIPAGNPFAGPSAPAGNDEIWSYGLRNPYRGSFDRLTGDMYLGDVGEGGREEIDFEVAGGPGGVNYGWRAYEGSQDSVGSNDPKPANAVDPIYDYPHAGSRFGSGSVTGGYVYRGSAIPSLYGSYVFGDFVNGEVTSFRYNGLTSSGLTDLTPQLDPTGTTFGQYSISTFGEDAAGELYIGVYGLLTEAAVYKIIPEPSSASLLAAGLSFMGLLRLRRSQATRH